jgi:ProP effector
MNLNAVHATIELLAATWPRCFAIKFRDRKPLKVGIANDVAAAATRAITAAELDAAFALYTRQAGYLKVLKEGAVRVDLEGAPAGTVTAEQAAMARRHIEKLERRKSARIRAQALAMEETLRKAKRTAEEAHREAEIAAGKRKPLLRLPRSEAASAAA